MSDKPPKRKPRQIPDDQCLCPTCQGMGRVPKPGINGRPRNFVFDALAEVTGTDPVTNGGLLGSVASKLSQAEPPYTPAEVREFGERFWEFCGYAERDGRTRPTPKEVEKNIGLVRASKAHPKTRKGQLSQEEYEARMAEVMK